MRYIVDLKEGEMVSDIYLCKSKQIAKTKSGKSYYSMTLQDKTGLIDTKVWDLSNAIEHFEALDYIKIDGQVTSFQGVLQLNAKRIRRCQEGEYDPSDYMPVSERDIEEMYEELLKAIEQIKDKYLKALVDSFFVEDKKFVSDFKKHSAAKSIHHSFMGGLLEHTLGVVKMCLHMSEQYPVLNKDLLISGALFHDIGKIEEISAFPENDYTDDGQLLGHILIGIEKVGERIKTIEGFPAKLSNELKHLIASHHGELEYGSPKKPALIEAVALSFADNIDAKMQTLMELFKSSDEKTGWLGYNKFFESNIRKTSVK